MALYRTRRWRALQRKKQTKGKDVVKTNRFSVGSWMLVAALVVMAVGCNNSSSNGTAGGGGGSAAGSGSTATSGDVPSFTLAWSEYPSWSIFGVAGEMGLIEKEEGKLGTIEEEYGVDIVLTEASYDSCLNMYVSKNCDAVCMTNMDALIVCPGRSGVAFLPTSTSNGADACIVAGIEDLEALKEHQVYGLKGTVSEYCFARCLAKMGEKEGKEYALDDFQFTNQDPGVAAAAMSNNQDTHQAIMVWNPFVLQTLNDRPDTSVIFDSSMIPGEIVDMVVMGKDVQDKPGAEAFAKAVVATFYAMNEELAKPDTGDEALVALGKKFSQLGLEDMKTVVEQTQFYKTAAEGAELLSSDAFKDTMKVVQEFCVAQGLVEDPTYSFGEDSGTQLLFDASFLK